MNALRKNFRSLMAPACLFFILPLACAIFNYGFVRLFSGVVLCGVYYACACLTLLCYCRRGIRPQVSMLLLGLFLFLYGAVCVFCQEEDLIYNYIFSMPIFLFGCVSWQIEDKPFRQWLLWLSGAAFAVTIALSIPTLLKHSDAARVLAAHQYVEFGYETYRKTGTGGFDFIFSLVVLLPCLIAAAFSVPGAYRWAAAALALGAAATIFLSGYTIAILLMAIALALVVFTLHKKVWRITLIAVPVMAVLVLIFRSDCAELIRRFADLFSAFAVRNHLKELAAILDGTASLGGLERAQLYAISTASFLQHPLLGAYIHSGVKAVSNHSTLMDLLGGGGLICMLPYLGFLISWHMQLEKRLDDRRLLAAWRITTVVYVLLQLVNPIFPNYLIIFSYMSLAAIILTTCGRQRTALKEAP